MAKKGLFLISNSIVDYNMYLNIAHSLNLPCNVEDGRIVQFNVEPRTVDANGVHFGRACSPIGAQSARSDCNKSHVNK